MKTGAESVNTTLKHSSNFQDKGQLEWLQTDRQTRQTETPRQTANKADRSANKGTVVGSLQIQRVSNLLWGLQSANE